MLCQSHEIRHEFVRRANDFFVAAVAFFDVEMASRHLLSQKLGQGMMVHRSKPAQ